MIIKKVTLRNIGPYQEDAEFNFEVEKSKNIVLIGGKNGSGKTTLLKAIKVGLFGPFAFGYKTINEYYVGQLNQLFNYKEVDKASSVFSIIVELEIEESYFKNIYTFSRAWKFINGKIIEDFSIMNDKNIMLKDQHNALIERIKESFPPKVIDSAIFDGERIGEMIENNSISQYIEDLFNTSFNLIYFEKLIEDTEIYISQKSTLSDFSNVEIEVFEQEKKFKQLKQRIKEISGTIDNYTKLILDKNTTKTMTEDEFKKMNGLEKEEKDRIILKLNSFESDKQRLNMRIKHSLESNIIPLFSYNSLLSVMDIIKKEKPIKFLKYLDEIQEYQGKEVESISDLKEKLKAISPINEMILSADKKSEVKVKAILDNNNLQTIKDFISDVNEFSNILDLNRKIKEIIVSSSDSDLEVYVNKLAELNNDITIFGDKVEELGREKNNLESELINVRDKLEKAEQELKTNKKSQSSFDVARNVIKTLEDTKSVIKRKNLLLISQLAIDTFKSVLRKENYISKIEISEDFMISIFNTNNRKLPLTLLSAGEKQLIISSLIFSIFQASGRDMFFVFDTPLARLDNDNRALFVSNLITKISSQVIVLSTDTEINKDLYPLIKTKIARKYLLDYDENENKTEIIEGYFSFSEVN